MNLPLIGIDQTPMTRQDVLDGIEELYQMWRRLASSLDNEMDTRLPDFEAMMRYVKLHGLPSETGDSFANGIRAMSRHCLSYLKHMESGQGTAKDMQAWLESVLENAEAWDKLAKKV